MDSAQESRCLSDMASDSSHATRACWPSARSQRLGRAVVTDKLLLGETVAMEVAGQFDIHSTETALRRFPTCTEGNLSLPSRPPPTELQGEGAATTVFFSGGDWYALWTGNDPGCLPTETDRLCKKSFWTIASLALTGENVGLHAYATYNNDKNTR